MRSRRAKIAVFVLCLAPLALLGWRGYQGNLTANPIEFVTRQTGVWTLRFLCITLAVAPLRRIPGLRDLIRFRRMIGLFAFSYGVLHMITWLWLDRFFDVREMLTDVLKRRFITAGMISFLLMVPLAITSTAGWIRRMGGKRWQRLHRLVYLSAVAGVVHYYWLVKSDVRSPVMYGAIVGLLLLSRVWRRSSTSAAKAHRAPGNV